jgi:hypothetical protein
MARKQFTKTCLGCGSQFSRPYNTTRYCSQQCAQPRTTIENVIEKLMANRAVTASGCWLWTGGVSASGYGAITISGKLEGVHRAAYAAFIGPIPDGKMVLHSCDVRLCFAKSHLRIGTAVDNSADMVSRNRGVDNAGSKHGMSKLTEDDVARIKARLASGDKDVDIAADSGCSSATISDIKSGRAWRHVA